MTEQSPWSVIHSSKDDCWRTPPKLVDKLNLEFDFKLDAAATFESKICESYMGPDHGVHTWQDALSTDWISSGAIFCNPPYGRNVGKWMEKCWNQAHYTKQPVVVLVMACTDTAWWHDFAWKADEIRLVRGRVHFLRADGTKAAASPKGSAIIIYRPHVPVDGWPGGPRVVSWDSK
jgi:phage N-6-adenine-methyltransferase